MGMLIVSIIRHVCEVSWRSYGRAKCMYVIKSKAWTLEMQLGKCNAQRLGKCSGAERRWYDFVSDRD